MNLWCNPKASSQALLRNIIFCLALGLAAHFRSAVFAATNTWTGANSQVPLNGDFNWSSAQNWAQQSAPANDGSADIVFTGQVGLTPNMDPDQAHNYTWNVHTIDFNVAAGAFTCKGGGNALTI